MKTNTAILEKASVAFEAAVRAKDEAVKENPKLAETPALSVVSRVLKSQADATGRLLDKEAKERSR